MLVLINRYRGVLSSEKPYFGILHPDPKLKNTVKYYWVLRDPAIAQAKAELLLPDGGAEIIFNLNSNPYLRWHSSEASDKSLIGKSYVVVNDGRSVYASRTGQISMVGIKFEGSGLYNLLQIPASEFTPAPVSIELVGRPLLQELEYQLYDVRSNIEAMKTLLDSFLLANMTQSRAGYCMPALAMMKASTQDLTIRHLTRSLGVHYSTLDRSFKKFIGMGPKALQRVIRFRRCFSSFQDNPFSFLKGREYFSYGYFDQTHFVKDFRSFVHCTPRQYLTKELTHSTEISLYHMEHDQDLILN